MMLPRVRYTVRQMMGAIVIVSFLMPGVILVLQADADLRLPVAVIVSFFYIFASPAVMAVTHLFFWPNQ